MVKATLSLCILVIASAMASAQTVTFTTQGGAAFPLHYTVVSEDGSPASGTFQVEQIYGYPNSGIVLPYNPAAPGQYLNPIIQITAQTYVYNGQTSRVVTYTFNSNADPQYGYVWSGTFTATENCSRTYRGRCSAYGSIGAGSGTMTASLAP